MLAYSIISRYLDKKVTWKMLQLAFSLTPERHYDLRKKSITILTEDKIAYIDSKSFNIPINDKVLKLIHKSFSNVNYEQNLLTAKNVDNQPILFQTDADFILFQEEEEALFDNFKLNEEEKESWNDNNVEEDYEEEEEYSDEIEYLEKHSKKCKHIPEPKFETGTFISNTIRLISFQNRYNDEEVKEIRQSNY